MTETDGEYLLLIYAHKSENFKEIRRNTIEKVSQKSPSLGI
jgi:hypothetical protein